MFVELLRKALAITDLFVVGYMGLYLFSNLILLLLSLREVRRILQRRTYEEAAPGAGTFTPKFSLLVPAYNEEVTITESLKSLLRLDYPELEIIIVNDGSKDRTVEVLRENFNFKEAPVDKAAHLPTAEVRAVYTAPVPEWSKVTRLVLVDKANGGKADALNAAINMAEGNFVASMDADSLMLPQTLHRVLQPILDDPNNMVAVGIQVAASNGSIVQDGRLVDPRLPSNWVARIQVVEYMRSFTQSRTALGRLNMLLILSGVFAVFRRDLMLAIGGFLTKYQKTRAGIEYCGEGAHTVCEDMEIILRLHRYLLDRGRKGKMLLLPEPLAWTEVPEDLTSLGKQRARWQRGLYECLLLHKGMFFKPRYGVVGWISLPYQVLYEAVTPVVELAGLLLIPISAAVGILSPRTAVLMMLTAFLANVVLSVGSIALALWVEPATRPSDRPQQLFTYSGRYILPKLLFAGVLENVGYRQWLLYWRLKGTWDWMRGQKGWDKFARKGFAATAAKS